MNKHNSPKLTSIRVNMANKIIKINDDSSMLRAIEKIENKLEAYLDSSRCTDVEYKKIIGKLNDLKLEKQEIIEEKTKKVEAIRSRIAQIDDILSKRQLRCEKKDNEVSFAESKNKACEILKMNISLAEKYDKLVEFLHKDKLDKILIRIEEIEDNRINLLDSEPENIQRSIKYDWRTLYYQKEKYVDRLRTILCSKLVHILWTSGSLVESTMAIKSGKITDKDGENLLNFKTSTYTYKGKSYVIFPEMSNILDKVFDSNVGIFIKWNRFDSLFNVNDVKCSEKCKCSSQSDICISYSYMFSELDKNFIRRRIYLPVYSDIE